MTTKDEIIYSLANRVYAQHEILQSLAMRKVSKDSTYNQTQKRFAEAYGKLTNEGELWTNDMIDQLLEAFLVKECFYLSKRECFLSICKRSQSAVNDMIWKLSVNYNRRSVRQYEPQKRTNRTDTEFTVRDYTVIEAATSHAGIMNKADKTFYIAKILFRSISNVDTFYSNCCREHGSENELFPNDNIDSWRVVKIVNKTVKKLLNGRTCRKVLYSSTSL